MNELDRILDAGLGSYSDAEPRVGLERRVLARVRAPERGRRWWPVWAAAAAAVVVAVSIGFRPSPEPPRPGPLVARMPAAELSMPQPPVTPRPVLKPRPLPKQEVFPAAAPLTPEERALAAWAGKAPELFEKPGADPIRIEEIKIEPLNGSH